MESSLKSDEETICATILGDLNDITNEGNDGKTK